MLCRAWESWCNPIQATICSSVATRGAKVAFEWLSVSQDSGWHWPLPLSLGRPLIRLFVAFYHPASLQLHLQIWGYWPSVCFITAEAGNVFLKYMLEEKGRKSRITDYRNKTRPHLISVDPYSGGTLLSLTSLLPWPGADTGAHPECHHIHPPHHNRSCSVPRCTSTVPLSNPVLWS